MKFIRYDQALVSAAGLPVSETTGFENIDWDAIQAAIGIDMCAPEVEFYCLGLDDPWNGHPRHAMVVFDEENIAEGGPFVVDTGVHTGRSPKDKFAVREPDSEDRIWWGPVNSELSVEHYEGLRGKVADYLGRLEALYVVDAFAGADPQHRISVRVVTSMPYHALFSATMFIAPGAHELEDFHPEAVVLHAPAFEADPAEDGTRTGTFCVFHPTKREIMIGGTFYAGEIKKSIFTLLNDSLPLENVFPMHCSANVGDDGDVAIFFGLSGTGKTTLSADPERHLIGDDEHGWGDSGVFNF